MSCLYCMMMQLCRMYLPLFHPKWKLCTPKHQDSQAVQGARFFPPRWAVFLKDNPMPPSTCIPLQFPELKYHPCPQEEAASLHRHSCWAGTGGTWCVAALAVLSYWLTVAEGTLLSLLVTVVHQCEAEASVPNLPQQLNS